jgi:hypothetical protein
LCERYNSHPLNIIGSNRFHLVELKTDRLAICLMICCPNGRRLLRTCVYESTTPMNPV